MLRLQPLLTQLLTQPHLVWSLEAHAAFQQLKNDVSFALVLQLPNFPILFVVETNASRVGIGVV